VPSGPDTSSPRTSEPDGVQRGLRPLRRSRLYEQVVERLRELIDVQGLGPGDRLMPERELAERLGVSRTSVRQALTALEVTGLVDIRHGGGVFLAERADAVLPSLATELLERYEQLPAVIEVREAIETQTARLAARRREQEDARAPLGGAQRADRPDPASFARATGPAPAQPRRASGDPRGDRGL
jgi:DNA-binding FadR family transcriptional regulator